MKRPIRISAAFSKGGVALAELAALLLIIVMFDVSKPKASKASPRKFMIPGSEQSKVD